MTWNLESTVTYPRRLGPMSIYQLQKNRDNYATVGPINCFFTIGSSVLRQGFKNLLHMALRLEEDALAVCGLPCTSYVFINSGTHGRKKAVPYGDENKSYVCTANLFLVLLLAYFL